MLVASAVLFVFPCCLLAAAWRCVLSDKREIKLPTWRWWCIGPALVLATFRGAATIIDMFSWFYNGGSPHGMGPWPGLWRTFGPLSLKLNVAAFALGIFGIRKARWFILGTPVAFFAVQILLHGLEMD